MEASFKNRFDKLNKQAQYFWSLANSLKDEQLHYNPGPNQWSVAQVLEHLYAVDKQTLAYLLNKNYESIRHKGRVRNWVYTLLLTLALKSRKKFKVPGKADIRPSDQPDLSLIVLDWKKTRQDLASYLENFPAPGRNRMVFRHPLVGALTMNQTLDFLYNHHGHHLPQIQKLLSTDIERRG
jgi:uncharacterized damage-inducible protein DinB